jgi:hypothetical protein
MEEGKNELVDLEEKTEGKPLKKPGTTSKAATPKTDEAKTAAPKTGKLKAGKSKAVVPETDTIKAAELEADAIKETAPKTGKSKAGTLKAATPKAATPKAGISAGEILNIQENEQEANNETCGFNPSLIENTDFGQLSDNSGIGNENEDKQQEKETEGIAKDATQDTTKKKNARKHKLCKLIKKNYLKKHFKEYEELVLSPRFICGKCGRVAKDAKSLCKPILISE